MLKPVHVKYPSQVMNISKPLNVTNQKPSFTGKSSISTAGVTNTSFVENYPTSANNTGAFGNV